MNSLKKISVIALLTFLPMVANATNPNMMEVRVGKSVAMIELPVIELPEVEIMPVLEIKERHISSAMVLLGRAKRENLARTNMRTARLTDTECLAIAMYHEARGEGRIGMESVARVIYNRVKHPNWPNGICEVVLQKSQFSFVGDRNTDRIKSWESFKTAVFIAVDLLDNKGFEKKDSPVRNALFFNSFTSRTQWAYARSRKFIATIGNHHFFN